MPTDDFFEPDCDLEPVPVPAGGALEGEDGYACESDGDCHLISVHRPTLRLFEVNDPGATRNESRLVREVEVHGGVNDWYLDVGDPPTMSVGSGNLAALMASISASARRQLSATRRRSLSASLSWRWPS